MKVGQRGISAWLDGTEPHQLEQRRPVYLENRVHPSYDRIPCYPEMDFTERNEGYFTVCFPPETFS